MFKQSLPVFALMTTILLAACGTPANPLQSRTQTPTSSVQAASMTSIKQMVNYVSNRMIKGYDKNSDGFLTRDEVSSAWSSDTFVKADTDKDGLLSLKEMIAYSLSPAQVASFRQLVIRNFGDFDTNHDKKLSFVEFHLGEYPDNQTRATQTFHLADHNHDEQLTQSEYEDEFAWYCAADVDSYLPPIVPSALPPTAPPSLPRR